MGRYKNGNPKRASRFICMHCIKENQLAGIQRFGHQREKYHIKTILCINPECKTETQNMEVRYCDSYDDVYEMALKMRDKYYNKRGNNEIRKAG